LSKDYRGLQVRITWRIAIGTGHTTTMNNLSLSHRTQLLATALAASLATAGLLHAYNVHTKRLRRKELNNEIQRSITAHSDEVQQVPSLEHPRLDPRITYDEELIQEQLARNYAFFGEESMARIRQASVVIVGCGGVGSWAAVMLARS
jgi:tRNA threonylcarbamoyladenosine dehydratase